MLGMAGFTLPMVETGIALSLVAFGALVALRAEIPCGAAMMIVAAFGLFHGFAHGAEAPADASGIAYIAGFALSTAALHACGVFAGLVVRRNARGVPRLPAGRPQRWASGSRAGDNLTPGLDVIPTCR